MAKRSLLEIAAGFRKASGSDLSTPGDFTFDKSSGISSEDQRDILLHIDKVAKSSRILAGPDTWKVRPKKRGFMLPLAVNVVGLLVLAGGIFGLRALFSGQAEKEATESVMVSSAEGRLLQEIKREAEGQIQEKDKEIADIQAQMAALDREKEQLLSSVETRIKAKEAELRDQLNIELERERQRLQAEGLSETAIQERLKEFEKKKQAEFNAALNDFTRKAEEERIALQANLDKARSEFNKSLSDATAERQRIQDEARAREQALREELNQKDKVLEAERAKTAESLRTAQAELAKFNEDATRTKATEDRLLGLYVSARQALRDGRIDDAAKTLEALRSYLSDPQVLALASLQARRELDLFTADLIERTISAERAKTGSDATKITDALNALATIRSQTEQARQALSAGKQAAAVEAYRKALGATKELEEAGTFLDEYWKAALDAQTAALDSTSSTRLANVQDALSAIDAAGADEKALSEAFTRLMATVPVDAALAARAYARIKETGSLEADSARRTADSAAAGSALRTAAADLSADRYLEAILGYTNILSRYPSAEQTSLAADGLREAGRGLAAAFEDARSKAEARISELETSLADNRSRISAMETTSAESARRISTLDSNLKEARDRVEALNSSLAESTTRMADSEARISALQTENSDLRSAVARAAESANQASTATNGPSSEEYLDLQAEKTRIEAELNTANARYDSIMTAYRNYAATEDRILGAGGDLALVNGRAGLDAFLSSAPVTGVMPGMRDRIATYLSAFQTAGQKEVLFNAADIVDGAARIQDPAVRTRYFADLEARYAGDESMLEFLSSVRSSFR